MWGILTGNQRNLGFRVGYIAALKHRTHSTRLLLVFKITVVQLFSLRVCHLCSNCFYSMLSGTFYHKSQEKRNLLCFPPGRLVPLPVLSPSPLVAVSICHSHPLRSLSMANLIISLSKCYAYRMANFGDITRKKPAYSRHRHTQQLRHISCISLCQLGREVILFGR